METQEILKKLEEIQRLCDRSSFYQSQLWHGLDKLIKHHQPVKDSNF
jgi:hypothetical protein